VACLLFRLEGPLQSWGYRSRFVDRDTAMEPTKSGIIGLLCCALGVDRSRSPSELAELKVHVRVDRQGTLLSDFQTAGGGVFRGSRAYYAPKSDGGASENPVIQTKHYLQDAAFTVALEGREELLERLAKALEDPHWPPFLGRKSCPPAAPFMPRLLRNASARDALQSDADKGARFLWEADEGELRADVPLRWSSSVDREYGYRFVQGELHLEEEEETE